LKSIARSVRSFLPSTFSFLPSAVMADCSEYAHRQKVAEPLQNRPRNLIPKSEAHEKSAIGKVLAINDFAAHRLFSPDGRNHGFVAQLPWTCSPDSGAVRTNVVSMDSLPFSGALGPNGRESHGDHNGESFFFPAVLVPKHALQGLSCSGSSRPLPTVLDFLCLPFLLARSLTEHYFACSWEETQSDGNLMRVGVFHVREGAH